MADDPRGSTFMPRYHWMLRVALAIPVLFGTAVAGSALVLHGSLVGAAIAVSIFVLPPLLGFGYALWYREIEFREDTIRMARPIFPDYTAPYAEVTRLGADAVTAGGRAIVWKLMGNGDQLEARFERLAEVGALDAGQFDGGEAPARRARRQARAISVGVFLGLSAGVSVTGLDLVSTLVVAAVGTAVAYGVLLRVLGPAE